MSEWKECRIGDMCRKITDGAHNSPAEVIEGYPMFSVKDMEENGFTYSNVKLISPDDYHKLVKSDCKPLKNDVLIAKDGSYLKHVFVCEEEKAEVILSSIAILRPNTKKVNPHFLKYILKTSSVKMMMEGFVSGSALPRIVLKDFKKMVLQIPSLTIQNSIASILSTYDELIETNNRRIAILEQTAEQIYKEWFVRMRFPGYENTEFEKGVPKDWSIQPLNDLAEITSSKRIFLSDYVKEGIPFYRGKEISMLSRNESIEDLLYIDINKFIEIKSRFGVPKVGDILVTAVGTIGNIHLVNENEGDFYFKDGNLIWLRNINNQEISLFLFSMFNTNEFCNLLDLISIGSSQKALTIAHVKKIKILVPSNRLLKEYYSIIKPIHQKIEVLQFQNKNLKQTRDLLLPRLISGKLKVKEAEKEIE